MPRTWTPTGAFRHFGAKPKNVQWSWSARIADGKTVVVTLWQHEFDGRQYRSHFERDDGDPRPGFKELMENLEWSQEHCGGKFRAIIAKARDPNAHPPSIAECFPGPMVMRLTSLDRKTGNFTAEIEGL
jgi:hypothetical protein